MPLLNPYEVLEPVKVDTVLVDLSSQEGSNVKNNNDSLQMGSFMDTKRKTEYDLVDLYQNIYVTPQHLQKSDKHDENDSFIDFKDFFDKSEKKNSCRNEMYGNNTSACTDDRNALDFDKLNGKLCNTSKVRTDYSNVNNELKDNMLQSHPLKDNKDINYSCNSTSNPKCYGNNHFNIFNNTGNDVKLKYELNNFNDNKSIFEIKSSEQVQSSTKNNTSIHNKMVQRIANIDVDKLMNDLSLLRIKNDRKQQVIDMINDKQFNAIIKNGKLLQMVKKDEKLYAKQCINTHQNKNFTKGADIYEKSIVLPQIMERLAARKKLIDDQGKFKRRLILDVSTHCSTKSENVLQEPVILMKDCNKERLKDLGARLLFVDFVKNGKMN